MEEAMKRNPFKSLLVHPLIERYGKGLMLAAMTRMTLLMK
jgi:hypothetical protein